MVSKGILATVSIMLMLVIGGGVYMAQQPPATILAPTPTFTTPAEAPTNLKTPPTTPSISPTKTLYETSNNAADGETLYKQNYDGCHG
jgi:hypothetical protein